MEEKQKQSKEGKERASSIAQAGAWPWSESQWHLRKTKKELVMRQNVEPGKLFSSS